MLMTKLKTAALVALVVVFAGTGTATLAYRTLGAGELGGQACAAPPAGPAQEAAPSSLDQALQAARTVEDLGLKARVLLLVAQAHIRAGDPAAALPTLQEASNAAAAISTNNAANLDDKLKLLARIAGAQAEAGDLEAA